MTCESSRTFLRFVMNAFQLYETVRITQLTRELEQYDGWGINQRPPQVGDVGSLIEILGTPGISANFIVECSGPDGVTIWLGDFQADEIEPWPERAA